MLVRARACVSIESTGERDIESERFRPRKAELRANSGTALMLSRFVLYFPLFMKTQKNITETLNHVQNNVIHVLGALWLSDALCW